MKLETIYVELKDLVSNGDFDYMKYLSLLDRIEEQVRLETSRKDSPRNRVNAIKRVASKNNDRPVFKGYANRCGYQVVTDTYHLIAIHQDNMPIPMVATSDELKEMGIDYKEYIEKNGRNSLINGIYPNMESILKYDTSNEIPMIDLNDLESFCKLHKKDKESYTIRTQSFNPQYIKNIVDVLGDNIKIYFQGDNKPLFFVNDKDEIGLLLPIRKY